MSEAWEGEVDDAIAAETGRQGVFNKELVDELGAPVSELRPCKHLDYDGTYMGCTIETCAPHFPNVRYWLRDERWTNNGPGQPPNPAKVQFCGAGRGRLNSIFDCYQEPGPMGCYEPKSPEASITE